MIDRDGPAAFLRRRRESLQPEDVGLRRGPRRAVRPGTRCAPPAGRLVSNQQYVASGGLADQSAGRPAGHGSQHAQQKPWSPMRNMDDARRTWETSSNLVGARFAGSPGTRPGL